MPMFPPPKWLFRLNTSLMGRGSVVSSRTTSLMNPPCTSLELIFSSSSPMLMRPEVLQRQRFETR